VAEISGFDPVFVHASPRSGSTYFFQVLRRNESLICFNEAIVDGKAGYARFRRPRERQRLRGRGAQKWDINHDFLDREDFEEFLDAWDEVMHLCPESPTFHDYLASDGIISRDLVVYLSALIKYAISREKRPVFCEVYSRGRAGALRSAFAGYHIAQYRDPLSQFGSFLRAAIDGRIWYFLANPLTSLGTSHTHPLFRLIPEDWRAPNFSWRTETWARRWGSEGKYFAAAASLQPNNIESLFRWHMFSWVLENLAAISYSDMALDMDKVHDDLNHRAAICSILEQKLGGVSPDFSDIRKFERYYEFDSFDVEMVCKEVMLVITDALQNGNLDVALRSLGKQPPIVRSATAVEALLDKVHNSLAAMPLSSGRRYMREAEWRIIVRKNRKIWFNPFVRWFAERIYPLARLIVHAGRRAGIPL